MPRVSGNEIISGRDFALWVRRYNASGIRMCEDTRRKVPVVYTSDLARSIETGQLIGHKVIQNSLFREAGIPLIQFPAIQLKAQKWLLLSRAFWLLGLNIKCESLKAVKQRVGIIVERIEAILIEKRCVVIVGHGVINRLIKRALLRRGWTLGQCGGGHGFLNQQRFNR